MTRSALLIPALLVLAACLPSGEPDSQTTPEPSHGGTDHNAMAHDAAGASSYSDLRFLDQMTVHHRMAVNMARTAVTKASSDEVRRMA